MADTAVLTWTPAKLRALKRALGKAVAEGRDEFEFGGQRYVTGYAKYLVAYLEGVFENERE